MSLVAVQTPSEQAPSSDAPRSAFEPWFFSAPGSDEQDFLIQIPLQALPTPRLSPMNAWEFRWIVAGMGQLPTRPGQFELRFRTYVQTRTEDVDLGPPVTRMLLQLWGYNVRNLRLDHSSAYFRQLVDVYLCDLGKPGGEQRFGEDPFNTDEFGRPRRANQIYIYDLPSFVNPIEMAREIAHEYGHATLPAIGGFDKPESWGNGFLGENLYLTWLMRDAQAGHLEVIDAMGTTTDDLISYYTKNISPRRLAVAATGPDIARILKRDESAMDHFVGLALHAESILPVVNFRRSLMLATNEAKDYPKAIVEAAAETEQLTLKVPADLRGKPFWIPLGKGTLNGLPVLERRQGWAKVRPTAEIIRVRNPKT